MALKAGEKGIKKSDLEALIKTLKEIAAALEDHEERIKALENETEV